MRRKSISVGICPGGMLILPMERGRIWKSIMSRKTPNTLSLPYLRIFCKKKGVSGEDSAFCLNLRQRIHTTFRLDFRLGMWYFIATKR